MKVIPASHEKPAPTISAYNKPFWDSARDHELRVQRCSECGKFWAPAGPVCPFCFSGTFTWEVVSGRAIITSFVIFHKSYHPEFDSDIPLVAALVQLDEGPRLITNILASKGRDVRSGASVELVYEDHENFTLPQFEVADE